MNPLTCCFCWASCQILFQMSHDPLLYVFVLLLFTVFSSGNKTIRFSFGTSDMTPRVCVRAAWGPEFNPRDSTGVCACCLMAWVQFPVTPRVCACCLRAWVQFPVTPQVYVHAAWGPEFNSPWLHGCVCMLLDGLSSIPVTPWVCVCCLWAWVQSLWLHGCVSVLPEGLSSIPVTPRVCVHAAWGSEFNSQDPYVWKEKPVVWLPYAHTQTNKCNFLKELNFKDS